MKKADELAGHDKALTEYVNFQMAAHVADPAYAQVLDGYSQAVLKNIADRERQEQRRLQQAQKGSIVKFGGYEWRVLDVQSNRALLLSDKILEQRPYHKDYTAITWEDCTLRQYLNSEFYNKFSQTDRNRIAAYKGLAHQWWLSSLGYDAGDTADVINDDGDIEGGFVVDLGYGGVRPALWLSL